MTYRLCLILLMSWALVACATSGTATDSTPTEEALSGTVDITFPMSGAIIYSESLYVAGTASQVPEQGFRIELVASDDQLISETVIVPEGDTWSTTIVHAYEGDPTELTVIAKSLNDTLTTAYDSEVIILSSLTERPDGVFGEITTPTSATTIGGDSLLITGRASGLFEGTFSLAIESEAGERLVQMPFTVINPSMLDDVLWTAELPRGDFMGNATIVMFYQSARDGREVILDRVDVTISRVAG